MIYYGKNIAEVEKMELYAIETFNKKSFELLNSDARRITRRFYEYSTTKKKIWIQKKESQERIK